MVLNRSADEGCRIPRGTKTQASYAADAADDSYAPLACWRLAWTPRRRRPPDGSLAWFGMPPAACYQV